MASVDTSASHLQPETKTREKSLDQAGRPHTVMALQGGTRPSVASLLYLPCDWRASQGSRREENHHEGKFTPSPIRPSKRFPSSHHAPGATADGLPSTLSLQDTHSPASELNSQRNLGGSMWVQGSNDEGERIQRFTSWIITIISGNSFLDTSKWNFQLSETTALKIQNSHLTIF